MTSVEKCTGATLGHTQSHVSVVVVLPSLDSASLDVLYQTAFFVVTKKFFF